MKIIGLIGGLSPESTSVYYQASSEGVRMRRGGHHGAAALSMALEGIA